MKKVYVNSVGSISSQKTFDNALFLEEVETYEEDVLVAITPNYKDYIPAAAARRMAKGIKMGVVASKIALQEANLANVDAVITGTGMGCLRDSEKFLSAILDNNELYLTPTSFIQSTHNTVGGQIALGIKCMGYNFTYVHSAISFESTLIDAHLMLSADEASTVLVGGVDELADHTTTVHKLIGHVKTEKVNTAELIPAKTPGAVFGEGANFFVLANEKHENTYAALLDIKIINTLSLERLEDSVIAFLTANNVAVTAIDVIVLGNNGDVDYDLYFTNLREGLFKNTQQVYYKHLCGEFGTASSFGFWLGSKIIKHQELPESVRLNQIKDTGFKTILLYNQYRGENHSFTLIQQC